MTKKLFTVDFEPLGRRAQVAHGTTLLEAAHQAGVGLNAACGGAGVCGTCRVRVVAGEVSPPTGAEEAGFRLACQARVLGDVRVDVPPDSITAPQRVQIEGRERPIELDPAVHAFDVTLEPPSLSDLQADVTRLCQSPVFAGQDIEFDHGVLVQLPGLLRSDDWRVRVVTEGDQVIAALPAGASPLGLAVDIGTTKLAAYLVDLEGGEMLAVAGAMNPQIAYGEDVMARIAYAMKGDAQARELQQVLVEGLGGLVDELCERANRGSSAVVEAVLVGNTCMHHLVLGLPANSLGLAPYVPILSDAYDLKARDLGLRLAPGANVHLLPNIAGFVGADHVAMVLATGIHEVDKVTLGLDIGTNTEIVLATGGAGGRLLSCSCASGPAFEGAHIRDGMRAAPGAVERVRLIGEQIEYQTVNDAPPVGICGSGILDAVAEMLRAGVLQVSGAMVGGSHPRVRGSGGSAEFLLVLAGERDAPRDLAITRKDINEIQLAKAAIRAGTEVLLSEAGLEADQVEKVVVAGAFGTYLDVGSALAIGMFPMLPQERFAQVGNAAGMGAKMALVSRHCRETAKEIAHRVEYVELTAHPRFVKFYASALMLP